MTTEEPVWITHPTQIVQHALEQWKNVWRGEKSSTQDDPQLDGRCVWFNPCPFRCHRSLSQTFGRHSEGRQVLPLDSHPHSCAYPVAAPFITEFAHGLQKLWYFLLTRGSNWRSALRVLPSEHRHIGLPPNNCYGHLCEPQWSKTGDLEMENRTRTGI